jgi:hypothetical protein
MSHLCSHNSCNPKLSDSLCWPNACVTMVVHGVTPKALTPEEVKLKRELKKLQKENEALKAGMEPKDAEVTSSESEAEVEDVPHLDIQPPHCPVHHLEMVLRANRTDQSLFFGCPRFATKDRCKQTVDYKASTSAHNSKSSAWKGEWNRSEIHSMTRAQLESCLDKSGVSYNSRTLVPELRELLRTKTPSKEKATSAVANPFSKMTKVQLLEWILEEGYPLRTDLAKGDKASEETLNRSRRGALECHALALMRGFPPTNLEKEGKSEVPQDKAKGKVPTIPVTVPGQK